MNQFSIPEIRVCTGLDAAIIENPKTACAVAAGIGLLVGAIIFGSTR